MTTLAQMLLADGEITTTGLARARPEWRGLGERLAPVLQPLLNVPVGNLAVQAYSKHRKITAAKERTLHKPGTTEVLSLAQHEIATTLHPEFQIEVNGVPAPLLRLDLELKLVIESITVTIERGHIVATQPGPATAAATLKSGKQVLLEAKTRPIELGNLRESGASIDLTSPIWTDDRTVDLTA